jgi:hypothetical protein
MVVVEAQRHAGAVQPEGERLMLRRSLLRSRTPLRRKTRINPRRLRPRRENADRDPAYLARVRKLPCLIRPCQRRSQAHHAGEHPTLGQKAPDITAIPLCRQHHVFEWHAKHGFCEGWDEAQRRQWQDEMIDRTQRVLGRKAA